MLINRIWIKEFSQTFRQRQDALTEIALFSPLYVCMYARILNMQGIFASLSAQSICFNSCLGILLVTFDFSLPINAVRVMTEIFFFPCSMALFKNYNFSYANVTV